MKEIKTKNYIKMGGKKERKKRDGTGPFEDSHQNKNFPKGKREMRGTECPNKDKENDDG